MTAIDIDDNKAIHPQLEQMKNETLAILWAGYMIDAAATHPKLRHTTDYLLIEVMLGKIRHEMTGRIQAELVVVFKHDMDKFLEVINFLTDIEETS